MSQSIATYNSKKRLVLSNGEAIRKMLIGNNWNVLRIGILGTVHTGATIAGTPVFSMGVCAGYQGYGSTTNPGTNLIGTRQVQSTWSWAANSGNSNVSGDSQAFKRVLGTYTNAGSALSGANMVFSAESPYTKRTGYFVQITKGSPNYTVEDAGLTNTTALADLSDDNFIALMESATMSGMSSVVTNYGVISGSGVTLAMDETNGDLDSVFVYWNRTSPVISIDAIAYRRLS